jgi:hypothetical protein
MERLKIQALSREVILAVALVGAATLAPLLHSQLVTGTIVNATLFVAAMSLGFGAASMIAAIPSLIALGVGTLPMALAPMVPFIIVSNVVLMASFVLLKKYSFPRAAIFACLVKFFFLASASSVVMNIFLPKALSPVLSSMMGWPQLITAALGAVVAYIFVTQNAKSI